MDKGDVCAYQRRDVEHIGVDQIPPFRPNVRPGSRDRPVRVDGRQRRRAVGDKQSICASTGSMYIWWRGKGGRNSERRKGKTFGMNTHLVTRR
jgi:hypothetical protein